MHFPVDQKRFGVVARNSIGFPRAVIDCLNAGDAVLTLRHAEDEERIASVGVDEILDPGEDTGWVDLPPYPASEETSTGQVLFTSGTEGLPKAILLSHAALSNTTDRLISIQGVDETIREYLGVPAYYSFGFGRCRVVARAGGRIFVPSNGFDPSEIAEMLSAGEINAISAVPTLWRLVLEHEDLFATCGDRVCWIEIGSQYMSRQEKERLKALFPNASIVQHYGLTEASRSTFLKIHEVEGAALESVGRGDEGVVTELDDTGRIRIRGPHLASGMLREGEPVPLTDGAGWFTTNDLGRIEEGYLYFEGRADDLINCGGVKLAPDALERDIHADLGISSGVCVTRIPDELRGDVVLVAHLDALDSNAVRSAAESVLERAGLVARGAVRFFPCEALPVTETGKIQRKEVARRYAEEAEPPKEEPTEDGRDTGPDAPASADMTRLVALWEDALGIRPVGVHDSFFDLGGDSLSAVRVVLRMERLGIPKQVAREIFHGKSISEIVEETERGTGRTPLSHAGRSADIVRGILVLLMIGSHWLPGVVERAPAAFETIYAALNPAFRAGTPGFAVIFGVGIGFAYLSRFRRSPDSVRALARRNAMLIGGGILALSGLKIGWRWIAGVPMTPVDYSNSFYNVLTYYFLAVLSIPLWLRFLTAARNFNLACLGAALVMQGIHLTLSANVPSASDNPFIQTGILLGWAKYNYFAMTSGVMVGIAFGQWIREAVTQDRPMSDLALAGAGLCVFALQIAFVAGDRFWETWPLDLSLWGWIFYSGIVAIAVPSIYGTRDLTTAWIEAPRRLLAIIGIMAFPLFIGHAMVVPVKKVLESLSIPGALPIALALFLAGAGWMGTHLYQVHYAED
jgi:acyl-coenzyme A synthetase/AMP-(fatty) acid ligase